MSGMSSYERWTVNNLKAELARRSASVKGRKKDLIERLEAYDRNENFRGPTVYTPPQNIIEWPTQGLRELTASARDVTQIQSHHVEVYFSECIKGSSNYQKVLDKGWDLMEAGRVVAASYRVVSSNVFFSGIVGAAMKKKVLYSVKARTDSAGMLLNTDCECVAGKGPTGACKHIACFSLTLATFNQTGKLHVRESCTSTLQRFHHPSGYSGSPIKAGGMKRPYGGDILQDPRKPKYRNAPGYTDRVRNYVSGFCYSSGLDLAMRYIFPKADIQAAAYDHAYLKDFFPEYWVDDALKNFPDSMADEDYFSGIERSTRGQSKNNLWHYHRKWRVTASNFGTICNATERRDMTKIYEQLLHPPQLQSAAVVYGRHMEATAILNFEKITGLQVSKCGLFVNKEFPFLGATPDGVIEHENALIEVKCPYTCKEEVITADKLPYMEMSSNSTMNLKVGSNYYCQVQGQMAISKIHKSYFVLYSPKTLFIEEICFREEFWNGLMIPKLQTFYAEYKSYIAKHM